MPLPLTLTSVAEILKVQTVWEHQQAEEMIRPQLGSLKQIHDYAALLKTFYGFYSPVEQSISNFVSKKLLPDISERRNSKLILRDLEALGISADSIPLCSRLPEIYSPATALGSMYVLEGSTLGGQMIARMLQKNPMLNLVPGQLNFFQGYREETGRKWKSFQAALNLLDGETEILVSAARQTFSLFTQWTEQTLHAKN
jgi:heme oxygenase (biliverdin-IX-beta and delta-forming)